MAADPIQKLHIPVMVREVLDFLNCGPEKVYLDCTVGLGGHAEAVLKASEPDGRVVGIDRDAEAIRLAGETLSGFQSRVTLLQGDYRQMERILASSETPQVDGVLFDLGLSSLQLSDPQRGFSFQVDGPLDMRMDPSSGQTAFDLVNNLSENSLADIIFLNGEERWSRRIASGIVQERETKPIQTTQQLSKIVSQSIPLKSRFGRLHPATRTFQALRIAVNEELEGLSEALHSAMRLVRPGGRICVLAFHSLEDRIVKRTFLQAGKGSSPPFSVLTRKPGRPNHEEVLENPRSRSAKLRVLERGAE